MTHYLWYIDIGAAAAQTVIVALIFRNYLGVGFTRIGKILLSVAATLLIESVSMIMIYYMWLSWGLGMEVAAPTLLITILNLIVTSLLYVISRL
ncbi:hypothetical protein JCM16161A_25440 [Vulcanisaeta sp. JCM 16161]|uniref:hypothetical protein n=1 Tax=Vulcanisaeta sp. JCM 16161 TaxID=1295372 RepID=UPI0006CFAC05|nr:hypothetical protein [Vulcanisaeta sp. JCM 16161]